MATSVSVRPAAISEPEWQVRCHLAALYRAFVRYGWTDLIYTHISARHPQRPDHYLINPYGLFFEEINASSLIVVDLDGNLIRGDHPYNDAGHAIHSSLLRARVDLNWVLHTHTRAGMAVSCMQCGLLPLTQQAMFVQDRIAYHPWDVQTAGPGECAALARDLGDKDLMILNNHGLIACGRSPGEAFTLLYMLETACKVQVDVTCSGQEMVVPDAQSLARTAAHGRAELRGEREWAAILRWLEHSDPSYRT